MTLDEAHDLIRAHLDSAPLCDRLEKRSYEEVYLRIIRELPPDEWAALLFRLEPDAQPTEHYPVVVLLARAIDRRPRLGMATGFRGAFQVLH